MEELSEITGVFFFLTNEIVALRVELKLITQYLFIVYNVLDTMFG